MGAFTSERVKQTAPKGWLPLSHAEAIQSLNNLRLDALCDRDEETLEEAGRIFGINKLYTDYRWLIEETRPDILSIATRTPGRCEIIEFAANHGVKGIHAEKPISRSIGEFKTAARALKNNDVKLTYGATRRNMEVFRRAKQIALGGEIGDIVQISADFGRTLLMWNHPHSVDLLLYFADCKKVDFIQAYCPVTAFNEKENLLDEDPIIEYAYVHFSNGIGGIISSAGGMNVCIAGDKGTITVAADGSWISIHKKGSGGGPYFLNRRKLDIEASRSGTQAAFDELISAVSLDEPLSLGLDEIECGQLILLGFVLSALRGGRRVSLSEIPDDFTVTGRFGEMFA